MQHGPFPSSSELIIFYRSFLTAPDLQSTACAHWILNASNRKKRNMQSFSPKSGFMTLSPCPGCIRHDPSIKFPARCNKKNSSLLCIVNVDITLATIIQDGPTRATHEAVFPFSYHELVPVVEQSHLYKTPTSPFSSPDLSDLPWFSLTTTSL